MMRVGNLILGAGIAGLACAARLSRFGDGGGYIVIEKDSDYGGLCGNFKMDGFRFDKFVHLSFTKDSVVRSFFDTVPYRTHVPNPENYYHGKWIKHPAQNNLFPLSEDEKNRVLEDVRKRGKYESVCQDDYEKWLRYQFGDYFAEHFPLVYTRKYWGVEARDLETKWVGDRVYKPSLDEILLGMRTSETPVTYYAKEMRYPKQGGFKSFFHSFADTDKIIFNEEVVAVDAKNKVVSTTKNEYRYECLFSSIPLPEYARLMVLPEDVREAAGQLCWTSGWMVSLGMRGELLKKNLWNYIYDEDILPARIYSPSEKSSDNAPEGCCSLQAEVYVKNGTEINISESEMMEKIIDQLDAAGIVNRDAVVLKDIRFEKYANVIFDRNIYAARKVVRDFLNMSGINTVGRFGEWDYLWTDQSFLSGWNCAERVCCVENQRI